MSKAPKNIEKILLGSAIVVAGGLAVLGFMKAGDAEETFNETVRSRGGSDTDVAEAMKVPEAVTSLKADRVIVSQVVPSKLIGQRSVDLFVGVPLFADRDNPNVPLDPLTSPIVHPPIENKWWVKYDVPLNFADSPQRDEDGDGFTNLEEYTAKTNPADGSDHPPLVAKLSYIKDDSLEWVVQFGMESGGKWFPKYLDGNKVKTKVGFANGLEAGGLFFDSDPVNGRFKFIEIQEREVFNKRLNSMEKLRIAIFEDQKDNKKGDKYEIPNRVPKMNMPDFYHYDRKAVLDLQALGFGGSEFTIEERRKFALPPDAESKDYLLKEVTPEAIVVEWSKDGETQSVTIPRGGLPDFDLEP